MTAIGSAKIEGGGLLKISGLSPVILPISTGLYLRNVTIDGDEFSFAYAGQQIVSVMLRPVSGAGRINYTLQIFNNTTDEVSSSYLVDSPGGPVGASLQTVNMVLNITDPAHAFSLRILVNSLSSEDAIELLNPVFSMIIFPLGISSQITPGDMNAGASGVFSTLSKFSWTNAMINALGVVVSGSIKICTIPPRTRVKNIYYSITGQASGVSTISGAIGRVPSEYVDYIVASNLKAAVNTIYGALAGERGTNLVGYDIPSWTSNTDIFMRLTCTGGTMDEVSGSSGDVLIETEVQP